MVKYCENCLCLKSLSAYFILFLGIVVGCSTHKNYPPLKLAENVNLEGVMGEWYIVATIPNWFERGMINPHDVLSLKENGDIKDDLYVRFYSFAAEKRHYATRSWVVNHDNARWQTEPIWPFNLPFLMIYADSEYKYLLWGEENRSYGWIYSRTPGIDDAKYEELLKIFADRGYNTSLFKRVVHTADDMKKAGYWTEKIK